VPHPPDLVFSQVTARWGVTLHTRKVAGPIPAGTTENQRMSEAISRRQVL